VLWKCRAWWSIALGWAAVSTAITALGFSFTLLSNGNYNPPPPGVFAAMFAGSLVTMCLVTLAVRRWGVMPLALLAACLVPRLLAEIPALILSKVTPPPDAFIAPVLWGVLIAISLYIGLLANAGRTEVPQTPPNSGLAGQPA